jgi:hypothetical protein
MDPFSLFVLGFVLPALCILLLIATFYQVLETSFLVIGYEIDGSFGSAMMGLFAMCSLAFFEISLVRLACIAVYIPLWSHVL